MDKEKLLELISHPVFQMVVKGYEPLSEPEGWYAEMGQVIRETGVTPQQIQILFEASSSSLSWCFHADSDVRASRMQFITDTDGPVAFGIKHSFSDSVGKLQATMKIFAEENQDELFADQVIMLRQIVDDIIDNYPRIFGSKTPDSVSDILEIYEAEILPVLDEQVASLSKGFDIEITGKEHLNRLPDAFLSLDTNIIYGVDLEPI